MNKSGTLILKLSVSKCFKDSLVKFQRETPCRFKFFIQGEQKTLDIGHNISMVLDKRKSNLGRQ